MTSYTYITQKEAVERMKKQTMDRAWEWIERNFFVASSKDTEDWKKEFYKSME